MSRPAATPSPPDRAPPVDRAARRPHLRAGARPHRRVRPPRRTARRKGLYYAMWRQQVGEGRIARGDRRAGAYGITGESARIKSFWNQRKPDCDPTSWGALPCTARTGAEQPGWDCFRVEGHGAKSINPPHGRQSGRQIPQDPVLSGPRPPADFAARIRSCDETRART